MKQKCIACEKTKEGCVQCGQNNNQSLYMCEDCSLMMMIPILSKLGDDDEKALGILELILPLAFSHCSTHGLEIFLSENQFSDKNGNPIKITLNSKSGSG